MILYRYGVVYLFYIPSSECSYGYTALWHLPLFPLA